MDVCSPQTELRGSEPLWISVFQIPGKTIPKVTGSKCPAGEVGHGNKEGRPSLKEKKKEWWVFHPYHGPLHSNKKKPSTELLDSLDESPGDYDEEKPKIYRVRSHSRHILEMQNSRESLPRAQRWGWVGMVLVRGPSGACSVGV